jgi:hypothetical protein
MLFRKCSQELEVVRRILVTAGMLLTCKSLFAILQFIFCILFLHLSLVLLFFLYFFIFLRRIDLCDAMGNVRRIICFVFWPFGNCHLQEIWTVRLLFLLLLYFVSAQLRLGIE